jgi:sulfite dehydrogenase
MLGRVEKAVAVAGWVIAAALVLMLFVGPQLVAEDKAEPAPQEAVGASPYAGGTEAALDGEALFTDNCGSCHTLSAAGTSGQVGPNLDEVSLDAVEIEAVVRDGQGTMPAFEDELSDQDIAAVAAFVADSR